MTVLECSFVKHSHCPLGVKRLNLPTTFEINKIKL
jgi:hypothetical protein